MLMYKQFLLTYIFKKCFFFLARFYVIFIGKRVSLSLLIKKVKYKEAKKGKGQLKLDPEEQILFKASITNNESYDDACQLIPLSHS